MVVLDGVAGIEVSTEKVWEFAEDLSFPAALVVNKLDRERSSFERAVESYSRDVRPTAVPVHLPLGAEKTF